MRNRFLNFISSLQEDDGDVGEAGADPRGFVKYHNSIPSRVLFHSLSLSK